MSSDPSARHVELLDHGGVGVVWQGPATAVVLVRIVSRGIRDLVIPLVAELHKAVAAVDPIVVAVRNGAHGPDVVPLVEVHLCAA